MKRTPIIRPFETLCAKTQRQMWRRGDPRVPEGWEPPPPTPRPKVVTKRICLRGPWNDHLTDAQISAFNAVGRKRYEIRQAPLIEVNGVSDAALQSAARTFVGLTSAVAAPTNVDPGTLTNAVGLGSNATNTNWFLYYGGSTAQTRINLGASFPINTTTAIDLTLWSPPNLAGVVYYYIEVIGTTTVATGVLGPGTAGVTLPASTTFLAHRAWRTNNTAAAAVGIDISGIYIETDY